MRESTDIRILMVCLGNICRSPLAQGIMEKLVEDQGLSHRIHVDSCGTSGYHVGEPPHPGSIDVARTHGVLIDHQRSRQLESDDFTNFDWLIAMDTTNRNTLRHLAPHVQSNDRTVLLLDYASGDSPRDVPDPYYVGGFERVYELIEDGCRGFLSHLLSP
mgnify:CR=1 FL=1